MSTTHFTGEELRKGTRDREKYEREARFKNDQTDRVAWSGLVTVSRHPADTRRIFLAGTPCPFTCH